MRRQETRLPSLQSAYEYWKNQTSLFAVIRRLKESTPLLIKSTFLGAHALPAAYKHDQTGYVNPVSYTHLLHRKFLLIIISPL